MRAVSVDQEMVAFLLDRIGEDEERARAATAGPWEWDRSRRGEWGHQPPDLVTVAKLPPYSDGSVGPVGYVISSWGHDYDGVEVSDADAAHIVAWDPVRVLAECKVKRLLVEDHAQRYAAGGELHDGETLRWLTLPYARHEGFRPEWLL